MLKNILIFFSLIFTVTELSAVTIAKKYYFDDFNIKLNFLLHSEEYEKSTIFKIDSYKTRERVKCRDILTKISEYTDETIKCKHSYVEFIKKSHFENSKLVEELEHYYKGYYPNMDIHSINIHPKSYLEELPATFHFKIKPKSYKKSSGNFYIISNEKKRYFFEYQLDATVEVLKSTIQIGRREIISSMNTKSKKIPFLSFKELPIKKKHLNLFEAIRRIKENSIITQRDIKKVFLVKRDQSVILQIRNGSLVIETSAVAMQNGKLNDIITIEKNDKSRLKAKVISKNLVEIN